MNMMIVCVIPAAAEADVESRVKKHHHRHPVILDDEDEDDVDVTEPPAQKRHRETGMCDF